MRSPDRDRQINVANRNALIRDLVTTGVIAALGIADSSKLIDPPLRGYLADFSAGFLIPLSSEPRLGQLFAGIASRTNPFGKLSFLDGKREENSFLRWPRVLGSGILLSAIELGQLVHFYPGTYDFPGDFISYGLGLSLYCGYSHINERLRRKQIQELPNL